MGASMRTIKANIPTFISTKASQPTFVFDKSNIDSNNKTMYEENKQINNSNNNYNNNVTDKNVFYGMTIEKTSKNIETTPLYS